MNSLAIDLKRIKRLIKIGNYEQATEQLFTILDSSQNYSNKELIYKSLALLNHVCDKTPSISVQTVKIVANFINDVNSWIRLESLEILYQISKFRPNLLIDLIEKIKSRLYDKDISVRRLAIKIIGNLILSLHIDIEKLQELLEEYIQKLMDNDWRVKLHVIKTLQNILKEDYTKIRDLEPLLSIIIINLRDEDDDVARASADLLKLLGTYFLSKEKILYVLLNLLYNEESSVKEHVVWLFGEIGKERSSEIIPIIPKLINILKDSDYSLQMKVMDALVGIANNNFEQIWSNLIDSLDTSNQEFRNNLVSTLYHLSENNMDKIFPYLFEEIENPSENIRESIILVLKRLFDEHQTEINNEIAKIFYKLGSKYWRKRKNTMILLMNLFYVLNDEKLAIWITLELNKLLKREKDTDVKIEITESLEKINTRFVNIESKISEIYNQLTLLHEGIKKFRRIPAQFREKLSTYINKFKFNKTEIQLRRMYDRILKKITIFDTNVNNFEYKRLAFDLMEEWEETKLQVIDELGIIKEFISDICEEKKQEFIVDLENRISLLEKKIDVLKIKFDHIKNYKFKLNLYVALSDINLDHDLEERFNQITDIRKNLFILDGEIRELLIQNLEFSDIFNDLLAKWIKNKIKIQKYLAEFERQVKLMKDNVLTHYFNIKDKPGVSDKETIDGLDKELAFQLLQGHFQSVISQAIDDTKKFDDNFRVIKSKLNYLIKKREYMQVKKLIELNSTQIQNFIQETEARIDGIIGKDKIFEKSNVYTLFVRPYLNKWNEHKEFLLEKSRKFLLKSKNKLNLSQIKYFLTIMNPIEFDFLSSYMGNSPVQLKELILKYINNGKLNAKIVKNSIYSQELEYEFPHSKEIMLQKQLKRIGDEVHIHFKLNNPSNFIYRDLYINLKIPTFLKFKKEISDPRIFYLNELRQGKGYEFDFMLSINKELKSIPPNRSDTNDIILDLYYKDPFDFVKRKTEKISVFFP